jgi:glycosidase
VNLGFTTDRAYQMPVNFSATSDIHHLELVPSLKAGLESYRQMCEKQMPLDTQTPASIREMVLLEIYPEYFPEGFKGITSKLSFYKDVGFNTIYLMPHWKGGYSPIDFYTVDPRFGTSQDLKEMVRMAHSLGMKVFFDMVIHGFNEKSPVITQRPDIFVKDEQGKLARHPMWKSITTDWANPAYKQYMADLALYDVKTYDIDGYRLDAATYKGPSWEPNLSYPAYLSGTAAPELMERMLEAMHTVKPEAVMLSEVFGPVFYTISNLVHDNQTEGPQFLLEKMEKGEYTAYDYKMHMQHVFSALPKGANRVYFARNHDTSWFYHFNGYTLRFMAMEAIHALCAIPEVFAGDPKNKPNPDDDKAVFEHYKKLFSLRKDYPELARGELLLEEVETNNPMVFTALRRMYGKITLVTVSLSDKEENVQITVPEKTVKGNINLIDGLSRQTIKSSLTNTGKIEIKLKPYQVIVGRLNAGAETRMNK